MIRDKSLISLLLFILFFMANNAHGGDQVRHSILAGSWYPASYEALKKTVDDYINKAEPKTDLTGKRVFALISPHAGYRYSGKAAAYGYNLIKGNNSIKRVIVLAPSHHVGFRGFSVLDVGAYETPLGKIPVDTEAAATLREHPLISSLPQAHSSEHSLEIQLPFIQEALGNFKLVPVVVGQLRPGDYSDLADAIKPFLDDETLLVVSSDFTHYGANFGYIPFYDNIKENLADLDGKAVNEILNKNFDGFRKYIQKTGVTICGREAISVLLKLVPEKATAEELTYYTSGDLTGDYHHSVSYVSVAFIVDKMRSEQTEKKPSAEQPE